MHILLVSDFNIPSGYATIGEGLALRWHELGHKVTVLGLAYRGNEHNYPFTLIPARLEWTPLTIVTLCKELKPDWVVFLMDLEKSNVLNENLSTTHPEFRTTYNVASAFPVESDPITQNWADKAAAFNKKLFTFTEFGKSVLEDAGLAPIKLSVGLSSFWYDPAFDEADRVFADGSKYILTVADNHLRKNLPTAIEMFRIFKETHADYKYVLITRPDNPIGWDLRELVKRADLGESIVLIPNSTVSRAQLKHIMANAACFLLPSHAEGIGLPIYEAQSQGCSVVATNCTSISEAVASPDLLIKVDHTSVFNWGTMRHYWPNLQDGVDKLNLALTADKRLIVYPTWDLAADQFIAELETTHEKTN